MPVRFNPWVAAAAAGIVGAGWLGYRSGPVEDAQIVFLDVGQGDCTVLESRGAFALVDAGPGQGRFDSGERLVAPKLRGMGAERIDLVILTHPDRDHTGGLPGLARRYRVERVAAARHFQRHPQLLQTLAEARIPPDRVVWVEDGWTVRLGDLRLELRVPFWAEGEPDNDGSIVVRAIAPEGASALLMGDAGDGVETLWMDRPGLASDLLKAGHHGSASATGAPWLQAVDPDWVIFSCGSGNTFGHPAAETVDRARRSGARTARTDLEGDIRFVFRSSEPERIP